MILRRCRKIWKFLLLVTLIAFVPAILHLRAVFNANSDAQEASLLHQVELLKEQVRQYELQLNEMKTVIAGNQVLRSKGDTCDAQNVLLRKASNHMKEFWWYLRAQIETSGYVSKHPDVAVFLRSHYWTMQREIFHFRDTNPTAAESVKQLEETITARLDQQQNPSNCSGEKYILCDVPLCGFGCQLHHVVYCLIVAYANHRTLVVNDGETDSSQYFKPVVSRPCRDYVMSRSDRTSFSRQNLQSQILTLPTIDVVEQLPYLPQAVPDEVARHLTAIHGHPSVWWIGQMARYLMRPNEFLQKRIDETKQRLGFKKPIVGMHVRRTDKIDAEASFHGVEEYFSKAEEFQHYVNLASQERRLRVFLATDEPQVYTDATKKYPSIDVLYNGQSADGRNALLGIVLDILLLAECDYLVCTFSSNVCRLAYQLMQSKYTDASWRFYSLDDFWYYSGQQQRRFVATMDHSPQNEKEIELNAGDELDVAGNEKNGSSVGRNKRTGRRGLFPSYKIEEVIISVKLPRDEQ